MCLGILPEIGINRHILRSRLGCSITPETHSIRVPLLFSGGEPGSLGLLVTLATISTMSHQVGVLVAEAGDHYYINGCFWFP